MTITIKEFETLDAIGEKAWQELLCRCPSATVFQSWRWLSAWQATVLAGKPWIVSAWQDDELIALAPLYIDAQANLKFLGEGHADYGQFIVKNDDRSYLEALLAHIFERADKWKHAQFACVLKGSALDAALRERGAWQSTSLASPRVLFNERSASSLLAKSSLKRHSKKLASLGKVEVRHMSAGTEIAPYLKEFFRQHQERWAITTTPSLFTNGNNKCFYLALTDGGQSQSELRFTVILLNGKPAAMHLGFISNHQLIWYKPTYDPRLSFAGPGEVLIAELIKYAQSEGLSGIDFTRGDESFKLRFCSEVREVATLETASEFLRKQIEAGRFKLKSLVVSAIDAMRLHRLAARSVHNVRATVRLLTTKGVSAAYKGIKEYFEQQGSQHIDIFIKQGAVADFCDKRITVRTLNTLDELLCEFDLDDPEHLEVLSDAPAYLQAGARLWVALCGKEIVCSGWELRGSGVDVTEVKARLSFPASVVCLMEFRTFSRHQRNGYYGALLKCISAADESEQHLIYALSHNRASVKAIRNAGFEHAGRLTRSALGALRLKSLKQGAAISATTLTREKQQK